MKWRSFLLFPAEPVCPTFLQAQPPGQLQRHSHTYASHTGLTWCSVKITTVGT